MLEFIEEYSTARATIPSKKNSNAGPAYPELRAGLKNGGSEEDLEFEVVDLHCDLGDKNTDLHEYAQEWMKKNNALRALCGKVEKESKEKLEAFEKVDIFGI